MIAFVSGKVVNVKEDYVVIENQGLGYQVFCPTTSSFQHGAELLLHTYYYVREDAILLFGFPTIEQHDFFVKLITVKGVGPKTGLNIMSRVPFEEIVNAIEEENVAFLKTLPGVGPKMASQIVLDLKGKLVKTSTKAIDNSHLEDVFVALGDLGFKRSECNQIKDELIASGLKDFNDLLRLGLKLLAR